jgi:hypothetical protein
MIKVKPALTKEIGPFVTRLKTARPLAKTPWPLHADGETVKKAAHPGPLRDRAGGGRAGRARGAVVTDS